MAYSTLVDEPYTQSHEKFLEETGITHHRIPFIANKDPAIKTPERVVNAILRLMLNKSNHPILIHCNKGKVSARSSASTDPLLTKW
jgi:tyrosine-protein phosphatase SIW14